MGCVNFRRNWEKFSLWIHQLAESSLDFNGAGNILTDVRPGETFAYAYNNRNCLASVTRNTAAWGTYIYNGMEQLVSRVSQSPAAPVGTIHYIYDLEGHLIAEANGSTGAVTRVYIWLPANDNSNDTLAEEMGIGSLQPSGLTRGDNTPDLPLAVVDIAGTTQTLLQVHTDHLGRPTRMTNAAKATVWSASYKPWGEVQAITGTATQNLRFPGQYFQVETGLAYNWHRTYDPVTGRYTQPDPLGFVDGPSVYAYAGNSPYMNVDPKGLQVIIVRPVPPGPIILNPRPNKGGFVIGDATGQGRGSRGRDILNDILNGWADIYNMCRRALGGSDERDEEDDSGRCEKISEECRNQCSDFLDTQPRIDLQSMHFHRCVNQCRFDQGCGGNDYGEGWNDGWDNGKLGTPRPWRN
jgi:RHS repeat-associated protein